MLAQTSLDAFFAQVKPELTKRESQVLDVIEQLGVACINDVAKELETFPNSISGRFTGLKKKGKIEFVERRQMPGRTTSADYWKVK